MINLKIIRGKQGINFVDLHRLGECYILYADLTAKRSEIFAYGQDYEKKEHNIYIGDNDNTLYSKKKGNDSSITVVGLPIDYDCIGYISRYSLITAFYPQNVYGKKPLAKWRCEKEKFSEKISFRRSSRGL